MDIGPARSALLWVCYPGLAKQGWYQICRRELHPFPDVAVCIAVLSFFQVTVSPAFTAVSAGA